MSSPAPLVYNPERLLGGEAVKWTKAIDAWTEAMRAAGMRPLTIELRRYQLGALAEAHLRRSPWSIKTSDLIGWLEGQDWSPETRKSYRGTLGSFFGWARKSGHMRRNPALDLPPVRVPRGEPRPTPEAVLADALGRASDRDRLILLLAAYAGLRRAEIAGLRWDHIGGDELRVVGKGGHVRRVPAHSMLAEELRAEWSRRNSGVFGSGYRYVGSVYPMYQPWVFPGQSAGHITPQAVGVAAARALGHGYTLHTLRHRFAGRAYANTHDLRVVQQLLGHASPSTTAVYAKADRDALRDAVAGI